jgi:hypothetical protein
MPPRRVDGHRAKTRRRSTDYHYSGLTNTPWLQAATVLGNLLLLTHFCASLCTSSRRQVTDSSSLSDIVSFHAGTTCEHDTMCCPTGSRIPARDLRWRRHLHSQHSSEALTSFHCITSIQCHLKGEHLKTGHRPTQHRCQTLLNQQRCDTPTKPSETVMVQFNIKRHKRAH